MDFKRDLDTFISDFGVKVEWGNVLGLGILDMPDTILGDGQSISTDYSLLVKSSQFSGLVARDEIKVDGVYYKVRDFRFIDDGLFGRVGLTKI